MRVTVRILGPADLTSYREIRLEALQNHPEAYGADFASASQQPDSYFLEALTRMTMFGAFSGDRLVGIAAFGRSDGIKQRHRGDIFQVFVRPEARGTGAAAALIDALLVHAEPLVEQVHLGVGAYNIPAIRTYEKAGFKVYATEPRALKVAGAYIDEHLMVRFFEGARKED